MRISSQTPFCTNGHIRTYSNGCDGGFTVAEGRLQSPLEPRHRCRNRCMCSVQKVFKDSIRVRIVLAVLIASTAL